MKTKFIIANWKENPESLETAQKLLKISETFHNQENFSQHIAITHAVPTIFAGLLKKENQKANIILQNISKFEKGSHTGEISATQAKNLNIEMSIVGHSETRLSPQNPHGDENKDINEKMAKIFAENMWACLCIGEYERENENWQKFLQNQIESCLENISQENLQKIVFAYEPVWAIGEQAKRPATKEEISETINFLKNFLNEKYNIDCKILYGGSVDENNAKEILNMEIVDGLLIGRASSDPEKWRNLLNNLNTNMQNFRIINDLNIQAGNTVLLRLDLNVPTNENGEITNFFRINESLPTILGLQKKDAKIVIVAHKEEGSLEKVAEYLETKIENFKFIQNFQEINPEKIFSSKNKTVFLLENIRLDKREKNKDEKDRDELGKELASLADFYINEAFSASHRNHASIISIPKFFPENKKCLGPKFLNEIEKLSLALSPKHPMLLLIGGAKFDTKLPMIEKFLNIANKIFVGGALAHSFWQKKNFELGKSLVDNEVTLSPKVLEEEVAGKIFLPDDVMTETKEIKKPESLENQDKIVDFGEKTLEKILGIAKNSQTIVWNGPVDFYEKGFDWGTKELIENFSKMENKTIILGGGDTVTEIEKVREEKRRAEPNFDFHFTHVSTGGGAMIDFLSNGTLPGIKAMK